MPVFLEQAFDEGAHTCDYTVIQFLDLSLRKKGSLDEGEENRAATSCIPPGGTKGPK